MQTHMVHSRPCGLPCGRHSVSTGSRQAVVALAKRKGGVSKELRELQQLKDSPAPTATASSPAPIPPASPAAPPPATGAPSSSPPPSTSASTWATSSGGSSSAPSSSNPSSSSGSSAATSGGSGLFDNLLIRILASVTAIMAVISVFYSIVFYGASNAVYIFKDQLAAITKKDFVPYSERRRLEQEVLAKLEAEQAERLRARGDGEAGEAAGAAAEGSGQEAMSAGAEDAGSSDELLNLLPSSGKKK